MALADLERRLASAGASLDRRSSHTVLDLLGHGQESLFDIRGVLGTRFEEWNVELLGELLRGLVVDSLASRKISLVADQQLVDTLTCVALNFLEPLLDILERCCVSETTYTHQ